MQTLQKKNIVTCVEDQGQFIEDQGQLQGMILT